MTSPEFLSRADFQAFYGDGIYRSTSRIPGNLIEILRPSSQHRPDYLGLLEKGLPWASESFLSFQPASHAALLEFAGRMELGMKLATQYFPSDPPSAFEAVMFECGGRMIEVHPSFGGDTFESGDDCFGSLLSLPDGLARSWLWRTGGWRIPCEPYSSYMLNRKLVSHPAYGWLHTDDYLDGLGRGWKKKFLPRIVEMFPDCLIPTKDEFDRDHYLFQCFLDTRPVNVFAPTGDQFFVISTRRNQIVYHVHAGDVANLRVLHDPVDAIDRYSAHTLRNLPGEFDFSPWSEPYRP